MNQQNLWLKLQSATWPFCPSTNVSSEKVKTGWDRVAEMPSSFYWFIRREYSTQSVGWTDSSLLRQADPAGISQRCLWQDGYGEISLLRLCVARGAQCLRLSINASLRYSRRAPRQRSFPVPPCPRLLCHCHPVCYFTSTALWILLFHCNPDNSRLWQMHYSLCNECNVKWSWDWIADKILLQEQKRDKSTIGCNKFRRIHD